MLPKRGIQIRVCGPDLIRDLVAGQIDPCFRFVHVGFRLRKPAFSRASIKHRPIQPKAHST
jgi:hypothetical protein